MARSINDYTPNLFSPIPCNHDESTIRPNCFHLV